MDVKTTEQKIKDFIYYNWYVLLIIALCVGMVFQWQLNQSTKAEVLKLQNVLAVQKTVDAIDAKLDNMTKRETDVYPALEKKLADLEKARQSFKAAEAKLKAPNQGVIQNEVNKLNEVEVNKLFHDLGYDTELRNCR